MMNHNLNKNNKIIEKDCIVVFFDILGFSDMVKNQKKYSAVEDNEQEESNSKTINSLIIIWRWIKKLEKINNQVIPFLFSDCGFLLFPINQKDNKQRKFFFCIQTLTKLVDRYFQEEYFLRGYVTHGKVTYTKNLLLGDAVSKAAKLESQCPGPFIFFPSVYAKSLIDINEKFTSIIEWVNVELAKDCGNETGLPILPSDRAKYLDEIIKRIKYYSIGKNNEFKKHTKFWKNAYDIISKFPDMHKKGFHDDRNNG